MNHDDLTIIYITANMIPETFAQNMRQNLFKVIGATPIVAVSRRPLSFGINLVVDSPRSHVNIYRNTLQGVKEARTEYIAIAEDDVLYHEEHFKHRPTRQGVFAYNANCWQIFTWQDPPIFSLSGRRNHAMLICERDMYIKAMEERFAKFPDDSQIDNAVFAEPGKYERQLGVTQQESELFYANPANIMFSHPQGLSHITLGERKRLSPVRAIEIPYWQKAEDILKLYTG